MTPWAVSHTHRTEEITLLCRGHHGEAESGLLPRADIIAANQNPANRGANSTPYQLRYSAPSCRLILGGSPSDSNPTVVQHAIGAAPLEALRLDGLPVLAFGYEDGVPLLTLKLFDEFNRPMLTIVENELIAVIQNIWDFEFIGKRLTIRAASRDLRIVVEFHPPDTVAAVTGLFLLNGIAVRIGDGGVQLLNNNIFLEGGTWQPDPCAFSFGVDRVHRDVAMVTTQDPINRYAGVRLTRRLSAGNGTPPTSVSE